MSETGKLKIIPCNIKDWAFGLHYFSEPGVSGRL